jgi:type I restriction enzyme, S subunit
VSTWPTFPVRRLFSIVNGGTPTADDENWGGSVPWATPVDLAQVNGGVLVATDRTLTESGLRAGSRAVPAGSLVLSTRAPIGYVAESTVRTALNQGCRGLSPTVPLTLRYFRHQFTSLADRLQAWGQGSTFVELSGDALAAFPLVVPPLPTQRAIADYLDREMERIDALIAAKQRTAGLLEKRMRLGAYEQTTSDGDRIPLRRLLRDIKTGSTPPAAEFDQLQDGDLGWYSPGDIGERLSLSAPARTLRSEAVTEGWVPQFPPDSTLLVGIGATAGRVAYLDGVASGNQQLTCLVAGAKIHPRFLAWQLFGRQDELRATAPFTTLPILNNEFVRSLVMMVPPISKQARIADTLDREATRISALAECEGRQVRLLRERRQALITAAVAGELDISEAA